MLVCSAHSVRPQVSKREGKHARWLHAVLLLCGGLLIAGTAGAQTDFNAHFSAACNGTPGADLGTACGSVMGGFTGSSETALTPNQALVLDASSEASARQDLGEAQQRMEVLRDQSADRPTAAAGTTLQLGRLALFGNTGVQWFDKDVTAREKGFNGQSYSVRIGGDWRFCDEFVGGLLFGSDSYRSEFDSDGGELDTDTFSGTLYGTLFLGDNAYVEGAFGYGWADYDIMRNAIFDDGVSSAELVTTRGDTEANQLSASFGAGYDFVHDGLTVTPFARFDWVRSDVDGYAETGSASYVTPGGTSGVEQRVDGIVSNSYTTAIGVRGGYALNHSWGVFLPQARVEYQHEFQDDDRVATTSFVDESTGVFNSLTGDDVDQDYVTVGVGILLVLPNGFMPYIDYQSLLAFSDFSQHTASVGIRKEF